MFKNERFFSRIAHLPLGLVPMRPKAKTCLQMEDKRRNNFLSYKAVFSTSQKNSISKEFCVWTIFCFLKPFSLQSNINQPNKFIYFLLKKARNWKNTLEHRSIDDTQNIDSLNTILQITYNKTEVEPIRKSADFRWLDRWFIWFDWTSIMPLWNI